MQTPPRPPDIGAAVSESIEVAPLWWSVEHRVIGLGELASSPSKTFRPAQIACDYRRMRGVLLPVAVCAVAAGLVVAFVAGGRGETPTTQEVAPAAEVTATPLVRSVRAADGADRVLQRQRTGNPCAAVPTMGCPRSTPIQMVPVLLVRDSADTIRAFIGEDPRNGCALDWRPEVQGGVFHDVCHGSLYDRQGHVAGGPSPWNLNQWAVEVKDGKVFVDSSKILPGLLAHP
jgi:Rieske Fe-S protein